MMKDKNLLGSLTRREKDVVDLLMQGKSNKMIALQLGISERTIEFHLNNIYSKAEVGSRVELILELGKATSGDFVLPVESTVDSEGGKEHNGNQPAQQSWAESVRSTASLIKKEIAMTIKISFEELENYLKNHPILFSLLVLFATSLAARYVVFEYILFK